MTKRVTNALLQKISLTGAEVIENAPISEYTTFDIGGRAAAFVKPNSADVLARIVSECKSGSVPFMVLGRGSNILFPDSDIDMVIISTMGLNGISLSGNNPTRITAGAGALLSRIAEFARDNGLSGFEFACGIPGTLGGGIRMNAGAYGGDIASVLHSAAVLDENLNTHILYKDEMDFRYRHSIIAEKDYIALEAEIALKPGDPDVIGAKMREFMTARNAKQPVEKKSAGSVFKRPAMDGVYAAALIEQCGLKGYSVGGARVSEKHAGFIINTGNATAQDVKTLIAHIRDVVYKQKGINLETEVIIAEQL